MDEYIPQLTLTPDLNAQPQPEVKKEEDLITKAQAAPEAGPDLSALSAQEQQAVLAFSKQIDLENAQQILEYGASAQKNIADFSDTALAKVKTGDLGEIGTMLSGLLVELKTMDEPEKKGIAGLFRKAKINAEEMKSRFATAEVNVDRISGELEKHKVTLLKDVAVMDQMYERNLQYFKELTMYILAGKQKLAEARNTTLRQLREKAEASNLPEDAQAANDFENKCVRFEKKLHDLELTRMISLQTAPQIRMIQNNDTALVEKIQTSVLNTIPLWKNQMVLTLGIENSRRAMEAQRQVTDMTNALLQKNADMLHMASVETAKESERGIVDMETLKHTNEQLISTLDEVLQIQTDGAKKRQEAEVELRRLEGVRPLPKNQVYEPDALRAVNEPFRLCDCILNGSALGPRHQPAALIAANHPFCIGPPAVSRRAHLKTPSSSSSYFAPLICSIVYALHHGLDFRGICLDNVQNNLALDKVHPFQFLLREPFGLVLQAPVRINVVLSVFQIFASQAAILHQLSSFRASTSKPQSAHSAAPSIFAPQLGQYL